MVHVDLHEVQATAKNLMSSNLSHIKMFVFLIYLLLHARTLYDGYILKYRNFLFILLYALMSNFHSELW